MLDVFKSMNTHTKKHINLGASDAVELDLTQTDISVWGQISSKGLIRPLQHKHYGNIIQNQSYYEYINLI